MKSIHDKQKYNCERCDYQATTSYKLKKHDLEMHVSNKKEDSNGKY